MKTKDIFKSINLSGNQINDTCMSAFVEVLSSTTKLEEFYFGSVSGGNLISDEGIKHLESITLGQDHLKNLSFSQNKLITDRSEATFNSISTTLNVVYLGLWQTGMTEEQSTKIMDLYNSENIHRYKQKLSKKYISNESDASILQDISTLNKFVGLYSIEVNQLLNKHNILAEKGIPDVQSKCNTLENDILKIKEVETAMVLKTADFDLIELGRQRDGFRENYINDMKETLKLIQAFTFKMDEEIRGIKENEIKIADFITGIEIERERIEHLNNFLTNTKERSQGFLKNPVVNDPFSSVVNNLEKLSFDAQTYFSKFYASFKSSYDSILKVYNEAQIKLTHATSKKTRNEVWLQENKDRISELTKYLDIQENIQQRREVVASVEEEVHATTTLMGEEEAKIHEARAKLARSRVNASKTVILDLEKVIAVHTRKLEQLETDLVDLLKKQEKECYDPETNELLFPDLIPMIPENSKAGENAQKESVEASLQSYASSSSSSIEPDQPIFHIPQAFKIRPRSYQIVDLIGNGGFSEVYKVRKVSDGSKDDFYAFKQFKIMSLTDKESKSIANEVEILTSINHGNIVSIKGLIGDPQSVDASGKLLGVGLMMEFCENLSLRNALDKQPNLELSRIYKILSGVSLGLGYLHSLEPNPIIHGDIKSDNVLIDSNWTAKLCDFGISKAISTITATRVTNGWAGTINYMAPEVHDEEEPESSSDIYSFGCLIFESLSGERPWQGLKPNIIMKKICMNKESMDYSKIRRDAPHKLSALMQKCLSYDKQYRPRIQEVNADIETLLDPVIISNLDKSSQEFKAIEIMFFPSSTNQQGSLNQNTFVIESIEKVQNDYTENIYASELRNIQRELGSSGGANERLLFHGTKRNDPYVVAKHRHGLMKDYSADGLYGRGLYFAELARYSHNGYAFRVSSTNQYKMLVCSVICGISNEKSASGDRTASHKTLAAQGCHSVHGGSNSGGDSSCMYVVYKDSQVTPRYIITYRNR